MNRQGDSVAHEESNWKETAIVPMQNGPLGALQLMKTELDKPSVNQEGDLHDTLNLPV